jgi:protein-tyrosine-phosphatase
MSVKVTTVLYLCTGNSARSIMAEAIMNKEGAGRFQAFSAGSVPAGLVNPFVLELLKAKGCALEGLRSKSWDEFSGGSAPDFDFVFTVCDNAAAEVCPLWPGRPMTAHWGLRDPAAVTGSDADKRAAFAAAFDEIANRVRAFMKLPLDSLGQSALQREIEALGEMVH